MKFSEPEGEFVNLLCPATGHIHLYLESDGELQIEEIVRRIKRCCNNAILREFSLIKEKLHGNH